jgi:hypothetical protein
VQQLAAQIPWGHNVLILDRVNVTKPIGVSAFELTASLPEPLRSSLPTVEDLEAELGEVADDDA